MKRVILFPGLGADERMFSKLDISSLSMHTIQNVHYPIPERNESLESYARRIAEKISQDEPLIFIGVSFGGIVAQEISKIVAPEKIILISSISSKNQRPFYFFMARALPLYRLLPDQFLKKLILFVGNLFTHKEKDAKALFVAMVKDSDAAFIRWGVDQVLSWKQLKPVRPVIHIHGSGDKLFPAHHIPVDHLIAEGEHFIIVQRAAEISRLISKIIQT